MKRTTILCACLIGFGATAAFAEVEDSDGDGVYSMEEMQAAYPDLTNEVFVQIDTNADGAIDADELAAAEEAGVLTAG